MIIVQRWERISDEWLLDTMRRAMRDHSIGEEAALRRVMSARSRCVRYISKTHTIERSLIDPSYVYTNRVPLSHGQREHIDSVHASLLKLDRRVRKGLTRNAQRRLHQRMMRARAT